MAEKCEDNTERTGRWEYLKGRVMKAIESILHPAMFGIKKKKKVAISLLLWLACFLNKELALVTALPG